MISPRMAKVNARVAMARAAIARLYGNKDPLAITIRQHAEHDLAVAERRQRALRMREKS